MRKLAEAVARQLELNRTKNLLHPRAEHLLEIDAPFVAALEELLASPSDSIARFNVDDIAAEAARSLVDTIHGMNQYIQLGRGAKESLAAIYVQSWKRLVESRDVELTLRTHHYPRIREFMEKLYPETLKEALRSARELGQIPSSEYSAGLQMRLLRLDASTMKDPILDIGCGRNAHLVTSLRAQNLIAHGIDRHVESTGGFLTQADWFDFDLGETGWGTIIAHLSFTNHMVYCDRHDPAQIPRYARRFRDILDSLVPGGSFVYAPGVPAREEVIEKKLYSVSNWRLSPRFTATRITKLAL